ncbi:MAG: MFS transporter [Rubrivivax sp.]|jgi:PAT family beta-lactamase induction signal transducer AmpG|nr:MFS transporter [Rubrivivax sp.]
MHLTADPARPRLTWTSLHRLVAVTLLGFASGLPLALTGQAMQAWLTTEGLSLSDIGFLTLVGVPYTFKFIWAPLMDRFDAGGWWRRRGWLLVTQLLLALALLAIAQMSPKASLTAFAMLGLTIAFLSASQDIVIDAYRTDVLSPAERGLGASLAVMGYRFAMILSGGVTLIWTDSVQGGGWTWPEVYRFMAWLMVGLAVVSLALLPRLPDLPDLPEDTPAGGATAPKRRSAWQDLAGFAAVVAAVAMGVELTRRFGQPAAQTLLAPVFEGSTLKPALQQRWADLLALLAGILVTLPMVVWAARKARFDPLLDGLRSYFSIRGAAAFLVFIILYKIGDAFAVSLMTPFLLTGMGYPAAEVGVVNKVIGLWLTIFGALLGGALMFRLGLWRSLMVFGVLQLLSNFGFWWLATGGKGSIGAMVLPAFDWGFVKITAATQVDGALLSAVAFDNLSGGMGTAAHVAFQMALCQQRFTATQYALLSALAAVGRVWVGPLAGVLAESIGWPSFFLVSVVLAVPALLMLLWLRSAVEDLDRRDTAATAAQA